MKYYWTGWKEEGKSEYMERLSTKEIELQTGPNHAFLSREEAQTSIDNSGDDKEDLVIFESETDDYDYGV